MLPYIAEFIGTMLLILLGDGVVANVNLERSGMKGAGAVQITFAWGLAVLVPAFIFGYVIAQFAGAFVGAVLVYVLFAGQFEATKDQGIKLGVFCTGPSIANTGLNLLSEIIGTFVLVFAILGIGNVENASSMGLNYFFVFAIIVSIGMSLGGLTGYAINPARDLGPRLAHAVLPIPGKGDSNFGYAWIPVVGPIIGALLAGGLFVVIPW